MPDPSIANETPEQFRKRIGTVLEERYQDLPTEFPNLPAEKLNMAGGNWDVYADQECAVAVAAQVLRDVLQLAYSHRGNPPFIDVDDVRAYAAERGITLEDQP